MASDESKHVFVSYVREDADQVDRLCALLDAAQIPYWRDRTSLAPGDQWKRVIRDAIRSGALVFLACFSNQSRAKAKSYMNEELTIAVEEFRKLPPGATWLIPVRFDDGVIPEWDLGAGRILSDLNYADLYGDKYPSEAVKLTTTVGRIMGSVGPDAATVRASIEQADSSERPAMMRRMTKEILPDPARRIEMDDLIVAETNRILEAMRDEERFPTQKLEGANEDKIVRCAEVVASYWRLVEPFCASLQVASRWADERGLAPWVSVLRTIANEATKRKGGVVVLLDLRHIPALIATFTVALSASGQGRWDNLKALLVDITLPGDYRNDRHSLIEAENPWTPFSNAADLLPSVVARVAKTGEDPKTALAVFMSKQAGTYKSPVAEWLHAILRPHFTDQYPHDDTFDAAFDRAEVILGLISQDIENVRAAANPDQSWKFDSRWFGRSTWRSAHRTGALDEVASEVEAQGESWPPLAAGLFGGSLERVTAAVSDYAVLFRKLANHRF
ncbi:toll/interleukin-1 receptor domain-containing protein [Kibdelosporangium aridum]|uniref:toll/interleukin-1 receptor domain-containing protein n=1 Tax=Kibdelosporangium aridum TaxID=2030 RepID=UPI0035EA92C5